MIAPSNATVSKVERRKETVIMTLCDFHSIHLHPSGRYVIKQYHPLQITSRYHINGSSYNIRRLNDAFCDSQSPNNKSRFEPPKKCASTSHTLCKHPTTRRSITTRAIYLGYTPLLAPTPNHSHSAQ